MKDLEAAADAIMNFDLGPCIDPDVIYRLWDLIPQEWCGEETRYNFAKRMSKEMAQAVLMVPDIEVWEPTMELRVRMFHDVGSPPAIRIVEQKFIRVRGGPSCGGGSSEWRPLPMVDSEGRPL